MKKQEPLDSGAELIRALDQIEKEDDISKDIILEAVENSLLTACKDEFKNSEGDPKVKGQQRQRMQQASRRRMMQNIPEADVVITNPTHFAVALKYDNNMSRAPVVVAKGADYLAYKIKDIARENDVEIYEDKPLARMLYANVEVGDEIPQELYQSVAEVFAYLINVKKSMKNMVS